MDTITQIALGAAIAEVGFKKKLGPKSLIAGGLLGLLPDLDMVASFAGPWGSMMHHRAASHSLLALALFAPLAGYICYRAARKKGGYLSWWHMAAWVLITHPLLDWFTTYGTQLAWPFSNRRFALDAVAIIDPIYTLPLIAIIVIGNIGKVPLRFRRRFGAGVMIFTVLYLVAGFLQGRAVESHAAALLEKEGPEPVAIRAMPLPLSSFLWRVVASYEERAYKVGHVSTLKMGEIKFFEMKSSSGPLAEKALKSDYGRKMAWFAQGMVALETEKREQGTQVTFRDMRFGYFSDPRKSVFTGNVIFNDNGEILSASPFRSSYDSNLPVEWQAFTSQLLGAQPED